MEKVLYNVRLTLKNDTEENWEKAVNFVPKKGEPIIYNKDAKHNYSRIKIGDGITKVSNLPFSDIDNVAKLDADNTFNGTVTVPMPTADNEAATKKYVDNLVCVSNTEPTNSNVSIWVDIS